MVGAICLFTVAAPVGIGLGVASGVGGLATMSGDKIANSVKSRRIGYRITDV